MLEFSTGKQIVRLLYHLNGYSIVLVEATEGLGIANGGIEWDIPTEQVPVHLRALGSRFYVTLIKSKSNPRSDVVIEELGDE